MASTTTTPTTTGPPAAPEEVFSAPPAARRWQWLNDKRLGRLFVAPAILLLVVLFIFPLLWALILSFSDYSATRNQPINWVWFENYARVITSDVVHSRAGVTAIFVVGAVALQTVLGFLTAYLISRQERGRGALAVLFMLPMMLSPVVVGAFWKLMLSSQFGVVNGLLELVGLPPQLWLTQTWLARLSLIVADSWQWTPFIMVIALAGLTAVPKYLYEAAEIDRASEWFKFRQITLPLVWPLLLIAVLFRAIDAFRLFDLVYVLTGGGPGSTSETLSYHLYKIAFLNFDTGTASAYGFLMVILVTIAAQFYVRYLGRLTAK